MSDVELRRQLENLFSGDMPDPEVTPEEPSPAERPTSGAEVEGSGSQETDTGASEAKGPCIDGAMEGAPEATSEEEVELGQGRVHIVNLLLSGATIGGGVAVLALAVAILRKPDRLFAWVPLFIGYAAIVSVFVVIQWLLVRSQRRVQRSLRDRGMALREEQALSQAHQRGLERANELLQRQAAHFELSAQVGRVAAMGLGLDEFADRAVDLIRERLDLCHVDLFLLDEERSYASLQASVGEAGEVSLARPERLAVGGDALLGQCVSGGQAYIVLNPDHSHDTNEGQAGHGLLLARTRSAVALPLIVQGRVYGVIALQSRGATALREEDLITLRAVADQVSTAISSAQLSEQLSARVREMEALQRYSVREAWEQFLPTRQKTLYEYDQPDVSPLDDCPLPEVDRVLADPKLTILEEGEGSVQSALLSPISLRDQVFGVLGLHQVEPDRPWTEEQIELVMAVSSQMGLIIENSRLFEQAQSRAGRERLVREIGARMQSTFDLDAVLQMVVQDLAEALNVPSAFVQLTPGGLRSPDSDRQK